MVVFIIGLSAGVVVMALPSEPDELNAEAHRLEQTIDILSRRAVLTETIHSLNVSRDGFGASNWQAGEWVTLPQFQHDLPISVQLDVVGDDPRRVPDRILFHPTGVPANAGISLLGSGGRRVELSAAPNKIELPR